MFSSSIMGDPEVKGLSPTRPWCASCQVEDEMTEPHGKDGSDRKFF
ncbi:MAG: hypothetical protein L0220_31230 [Acidobacteria bacterium]|nr:hypothetical protein [Acidobacteriota bacterium]